MSASPVLLDNAAMRLNLAVAGFAHALPAGALADAMYAPPRADWLRGEFAGWFRQCLQRMEIASYVPEAGDCDDFAALYASLARICHRRGWAGGQPAALPVGELHYVSSELGPHAVVVAVTSDQGVIVIEPQDPARVLTLSSAERSSAWLCKL